jgi:hypothetical protein
MGRGYRRGYGGACRITGFRGTAEDPLNPGYPLWTKSLSPLIFEPTEAGGLGIGYAYGLATAGIVCLDDVRGPGADAPEFLVFQGLRRRWPLIGGGLIAKREVECTVAVARSHDDAKGPTMAKRNNGPQRPTTRSWLESSEKCAIKARGLSTTLIGRVMEARRARGYVPLDGSTRGWRVIGFVVVAAAAHEWIRGGATDAYAR